MLRFLSPLALLSLATVLGTSVAQKKGDEPLFLDPINVDVPLIATDKTVKYDYDIVYVRGPRAGDKVHKRFYTDIATPVTLEPGADLMLLHPDGAEELLVKGGEGAITDPVVGFNGQWVYYTHIYSMKNAGAYQPPAKGADIFKINLKSRKIVRLTNQVFTPNTGVADWSKDCRAAEPGKHHFSYGVQNFGPCPLPGRKLAFTSNRDGYRPPRGYPQIALQLFVIDDADESVAEDDPYPGNIHKIGHLNIAGALHPVVLTDGRIMFSSLESQGIRNSILWGIWTIHPDGTNWAPLVSAFDPGGAPNAFHFQTQLGDGSLVIEEYYNQNNSGFGAYIKMPPTPPEGQPAFGPANMRDPRNRPWRFGRFDNGKAKWYRMPFMPVGSESITPFSRVDDGPADHAILGDKTSPRVGKFTHPSGAPDNHLLTIYSPGPVNHQYTFLPQLDGGIYLIKGGTTINEPAQMLLIKNDPNYNEQWPRAVVPYKRIYGIDEPKKLTPLANDGKLSKHLPEGTPFGLVGSASLYKRESYPGGGVPKGKTTASYAGGNDPWKGLDAFTSHGNGMPLNWANQGADAGLYDNSDIHAVRILAMEPTTDRNRGPKSGRLFYSHARERLRILGEIPVRHFQASPDRKGGEQPLDPDGNPDTSFLAKIPSDTAFTFQTIDRHGMVLNMAQTWHQLRPGEIRTNCGGCHAHSQQPTRFEDTTAGKPGYKIFDLTQGAVPLVTTKDKDGSKQTWDKEGATGLRTVKAGVVNVEYLRDVKPILQRSCVVCHTAKAGKEPAAKLNLDADDELVPLEYVGKLPGTYARLAADERGRFGIKPVGYDSWGYPQSSRYVRMLQSRRSVLVWKIYGERLDGFTNDDHPSESPPGSGTIMHKGKEVDAKTNRHRLDLDYIGSAMPPPEAVAGTYVGPDGAKVKVPPLSDEDRRTIVRWIDLGCPIDLDYDADHPERRGHGWMADDNRPVVALASPQPGENAELSRILLGLHDYYSGLDMNSLRVTADFEVNGHKAGTNLAKEFQAKSPGVWELRLREVICDLARGRLSVSIRDRQGNVTRVERLFAVGAGQPPKQDPPQPVPAEVIAAWKKAGARSGWIGLNAEGFLAYEENAPKLTAAVRAFRFSPWRADVVTKLPVPPGPFGLSLNNSKVADAGLKELAELKTLHTLDLSRTAVTDTGLKELASLGKLHTLALAQTHVADAGLKELAGLKSLRTLHLGGTKVTDAGLKELASLENLHTLDLNFTKVTDAGAKALGALKSLHTLSLISTQVGDAGLKELTGLKDLRTLYLISTQVTDAGLKELAGLKALRTLNLQNTKVTDAGLKELGGLGSLHALTLSGTQITDAGLKELAGLAGLRTLDITRTKATSAGAAELGKALPECRIFR